MGKNLKSYDDRRGNDVQIIGGELRLGNMLPGGVEQEIDEQSATQNYALGTRKFLDYGERVFVYAHIYTDYPCGRGRAVVAYNTAATEKGAFLGELTKGAFTVDWTVVGTTIAKDQFAEGHLMIQGGFVKRIKSHPAGSIGVACALLLHEKFTRTTIVAGQEGMLVENKYANVYNRQYLGSTLPGLVVGVTPIDFTASYYGWIQVKGPCAVLSSQNDKGDADGESVFVAHTDTGDEIALQAAWGYQVIGHTIPHNTLNWDGENFIFLNLCIE